MELQNEYLIIIDKKTSSPFYSLCNSVERFNEFIETETKLKVKNNKIKMDKSNYDYLIKQGKVKGKEQNFFYITLKFNGNEESIEEYKDLLRTIKKVFQSNKIIMETLRDDLSFHYSKLAYSLIHNIENMMRKFITYFMITNVGKDWVNESSPTHIQEALDKTKRKEYIDVLQQLDFIHLGDLLFKVYSEDDISDLFKKIKILENNINVSELQSYLPKSNWEKYFKEIIDCDDLYLKKRWEQLYALRNKIAHTSNFTIGDYEDIQTLVSEVKEKLEKTFENIDTIELLDKDKKQLSENIATNINEDIGIFIREWNKLERRLERLSNSTHPSNILSNLEKIKEKNHFEASLINSIKKMNIFRNQLIHRTDIISYERIKISIEEIKEINNKLKLNWGFEVLEAFKRLNKEATLNEIYSSIEENTDRELTDSWKSSVRKTIYYYSSDADLFIGKEDLYQKIGKGKWKLR